MSLLLVYGISLMVMNYTPVYEIESITSKVNTLESVRKLSILYDNETEEWVGHLAEKLEMPLMLNVWQPPNRGIRLVGDPNTMVLIMDENMSADQVLNATLRYHNTVYLFITHSLEDVQYRLQQFWDCLVISAYALYFNGTDGQLYGFDPSPNGIIVTKKDRLQIIDVFDGHGLPVNTSIVNHPPPIIQQEKETDIEGYEGRIIKEVTEKFNLRTRYAKPRDGELWGWVYPEPGGVIGEVLTEYSAFGIGNVAATACRSEAIDQLPGYSIMECISWVVPKGAGAAAPTWVSMLITEYTLDSWLGIIVSSICIIIACAAIDDNGFFWTIFRIFAVSIGAPVHLPKKTSSRILMTVWVWATFVIAIAYQSSMGSKLAVPPVNPDLNTFQELFDSNLEILGIFNSIRLMAEEDPLIHALQLRTTHTPLNLSVILNRISKQRDLAFLRHISRLKYNAILDPSSLDGCHVMNKVCAVTYQPSILMSRWSPYFRGTHKIVQRLTESGLVVKWQRDLMPEIPSPSNPPAPLGLNRLLGVFAMLFVGYTISAIAYIGEKAWFLGWKRVFRIIKKLKMQPMRTKVHRIKLITDVKDM